MARVKLWFAHRHPTSIGRLLAKAVFITLLVATSATVTAPLSVAYGPVWDKLAACESSGRWHVATGNGYYGGLQFSLSTWRAYGGAHYAPNAARARRAHQVAVARRVVADVGWSAWPQCSRTLGLTR
ncbi:transglycosylase family protein [Streptomyces sp. NPDC057743]|uniref:transglycosylase family protein n=1 Tax=Streptomyces sp. NPDC057743 TaxID=3346236 RepID=UPI0036CE0A99